MVRLVDFPNGIVCKDSCRDAVRNRLRRFPPRGLRHLVCLAALFTVGPNNWLIIGSDLPGTSDLETCCGAHPGHSGPPYTRANRSPAPCLRWGPSGVRSRYCAIKFSSSPSQDRGTGVTWRVALSLPVLHAGFFHLVSNSSVSYEESCDVLW